MLHAFDPVAAQAAAIGRHAFDDHCEQVGVNSNAREQWLAARRQGLGGSEVAAILNMNPYKSALELYAEKVGAMPANDTENEVALWGNVFELPILREYARRSKRHVVPCGELLRRRDRPWHQVTPDGVQLTGAPEWADGPGIAEVKLTAFDWRDEVAPYVSVQLQHQLSVTGAAWNTLVVLPVPERRLWWLDVAPHREFQALLAEKVDAFWTRVLERRPPDADGSASARRALFALEPDLVDECVALDESAEAIADELDEINRTLKALEDRKSLIANRVLQTLGEYKVALLPDTGRYFNSWRTEASESACPNCSTVHTTRKGFRACRLMPPRKKPHAMPREQRVLELHPDREVADLLRASLELLQPR